MAYKLPMKRAGRSNSVFCYKKKKAGLGLSTKLFVRYNLNDWFYPGYTFYYPDDELTCIALLLGRYAWLEDSGVFHDIQKTEELPTAPSEDRLAFKLKDRGTFYKRTETDFGLREHRRVYDWEGYKERSEEIELWKIR